MAASELLRMRVVAATLGVLLPADQLLYLFARDLVEQFYQKPLPAWLPARIIGPFLAFEIVALLVLHYRLVGGNTVPSRASMRSCRSRFGCLGSARWFGGAFWSPSDLRSVSCTA